MSMKGESMKEIFRIGEVSKLCNISIKTLRFYEEEGLIKPVEVDIFTGYRHYDEKNIERIYEIQFLKSLNFSLKEIKALDSKSFSNKKDELENQIKQLRQKISKLSTFNKFKGENKMKVFINDPQAIGKWKYVASCMSKENYYKGDYAFDKEIFLKDLYFLPNGEGYWIFEGWTKGEVFQCKGDKYQYEIEKDLMFLNISKEKFEVCLVFKKEDSKNYDIEEIKIKDDVNIKFEFDNRLVGFWKPVDYIGVTKKENYVPSKSTKGESFVFKGMQFAPDGTGILKFKKDNIECNWTKDFILNKINDTASNYIIKTIDNKDYCIMDWKSGDYTFAGEIHGCYVFEKMKGEN